MPRWCGQRDVGGGCFIPQRKDRRLRRDGEQLDFPLGNKPPKSRFGREDIEKGKRKSTTRDSRPVGGTRKKLKSVRESLDETGGGVGLRAFLTVTYSASSLDAKQKAVCRSGQVRSVQTLTRQENLNVRSG